MFIALSIYLAVVSKLHIHTPGLLSVSYSIPGLYVLSWSDRDLSLWLLVSQIYTFCRHVLLPLILWLYRQRNIISADSRSDTNLDLYVYTNRYKLRPVCIHKQREIMHNTTHDITDRSIHDTDCILSYIVWYCCSDCSLNDMDKMQLTKMVYGFWEMNGSVSQYQWQPDWIFENYQIAKL